MLLVVFGAGASYDSVPSRPPKHHFDLPERPPLAADLFGDRTLFASVMNRFPKCRAIIPYLQEPADGKRVEEVLETLLAEAMDYPERNRQITAVRYYLQFMIWECEQRWNETAVNEAGGATNYITLLDQIERWRKPKETVCLVTFNYDTMLESALTSLDVSIGNISDYISGERYKLIKLHGSINWGRDIDTYIETQKRNAWQVVDEVIERSPDLQVSEIYRIVNERPIAKTRTSALFPAIAIPVETKREYECPPEHLAALVGLLSKFNKLLCIGWRAREEHFLHLLAKKLRKDMRIMAVASGSQDAQETLDRIQKVGITGEFSVMPGGFTDFIKHRRVEELLQAYT